MIPPVLAQDPRAARRNDRFVDPRGRCVVYWMQRAQRAIDNPALDAAIAAGNAMGLPVAVHLGLVPSYPGANLRHYAFLVQGIDETARTVRARGAAFCFRPWPAHSLATFCGEVRPALVVGDENPLREPERWRRVVADRLDVPLVTVDADVVVPTRLMPKEEWAARTIRPRIARHLERFLVPGDAPHCRVPWPAGAEPVSDPTDDAALAALLGRMPLDRSAAPVPGTRGGTAAGLARLGAFLRDGLAGYPRDHGRADRPDGTSRLAPYLHFGHLGPRAVALAVQASDAPQDAKDAFLEQLIVRRELAINFCARNPDYDGWRGLPAWGRQTLEAHAADARDPAYDAADLEAARTHDPLWNAAQTQLVRAGFMHNHLRMYWAKKILEWTPDPREALAIAIRFNDRWSLDGRDPNGYAGVAWAIGGRHDRPWAPQRPVFGMVRYMSLASTSRKFDWRAYARQVEALPGNG